MQRSLESSDLNALKRQDEAGRAVMAARNAHRKGEAERAQEFIKQAFAANPGDVGAIEFLGDVYLEAGETERALALFERALKAHPQHAAFEEKLAICRLDLAEMESDRLAKKMLVDGGDAGKIFERVPNKAVSLSVILPGAGQLYNEQIEKGIGFALAALVSCIGWFYPLWTQVGKQVAAKVSPDLGRAISAMSGGSSMLFWVSLLVWIGVYVVGAIDAGKVAAAYNRGRRRSLGLE